MAESSEIPDCIIDNPSNMRREVIINGYVAASMDGTMLYLKRPPTIPFYFGVNRVFVPGAMYTLDEAKLAIEYLKQKEAV